MVLTIGREREILDRSPSIPSLSIPGFPALHTCPCNIDPNLNEEFQLATHNAVLHTIILCTQNILDFMSKHIHITHYTSMVI